MVEICLMASHVYPPGPVFHPEQCMPRFPKSCQTFLPSLGSRQDMIGSCSLIPSSYQSEEPWKPMGGLLEATDSSIRRPVLNVQETCPNSIHFGFGIAEQCIRHKKILKFLMSGSNVVEKGGVDLSVLSDLMGLEVVTTDVLQQPLASDYRPFFHNVESQSSLIYPSSEFYSHKPILDLMGNWPHRSEIMVHPDGQVLLSVAETEMRDVLSIIAKFYLSMNSVKRRKQSVLVPHFNRLDSSEARASIHGSSLKLETLKVAPLKSPGKIKLKPLPKKKSNRKSRKERDLYRKNYFHACESLLSIIVDKKRNGKTSILSLKKSGPELPQLLTQLSASIAGTGLAVLFSVVCKVACSRVPFCASRFLNTGLGLGLVWLSWAVNRLRDTVVHISKNSAKMSLTEDEMMKNLDRSVKEISFRVVTLMVVAVLRLA